MSDTRSKHVLLPSGYSTCEHTVQKHPSWFMEVDCTAIAYGMASMLTQYFPYCRASSPFQSTTTQWGDSVSDTRSKCVFVPSREVTLSFVRRCLKLALRKWQLICDTTERHPNTTHTHTRTHKPTRTSMHTHTRTSLLQLRESCASTASVPKNTQHAHTHTHKYTPKPTRTHTHTHTHTTTERPTHTRAHPQAHTATRTTVLTEGWRSASTASLPNNHRHPDKSPIRCFKISKPA